MDAISAVLYLRSRETLQLQHVVHIQIQKYRRVQQRQHTKSIKDDEEPDAVEEIATCEHSHLKSPGRNQSDDTAFSMLTLLYDIRLVLPFLQLIFQHSGNTDIKIFTMGPWPYISCM